MVIVCCDECRAVTRELRAVYDVWSADVLLWLCVPCYDARLARLAALYAGD